MALHQNRRDQGTTVSNFRRFRRALALGAAASVLPTGVVHASEAGDAQIPIPVSGTDVLANDLVGGGTGPIIWQGSVPGATPDSVVVVHAEDVTGGITEEGLTGKRIDLVKVGRATVGDDGLFTVRAEPGDWYQSIADSDGRIRLMITASAQNGRQFGMGMTIVQLATATDAAKGVAEGTWMVDQAMETSLADLEPTESGDLTDAAARRSTSVPTSPIVMTEAPPELLETAGGAGGVARAAYPPEYSCYGGSVVDALSTTWVEMGNYYHEEFAPTHTFRYEASNTTTTEWGYKVGGTAGAFTGTGRVSMATQTSTGVSGGHNQVQTGKKMKATAIVDIRYRRVGGFKG